MEALNIIWPDYGLIVAGFAMGWLCAFLGWGVRIILRAVMLDSDGDIL
jgi:hypothetical protein